MRQAFKHLIASGLNNMSTFLRILPLKEDVVRKAAMLRDGRVLVLRQDRSVLSIDCNNGSDFSITHLMRQGSERAMTATLLADGDHVLIGFHIWSLVTGEAVAVLPVPSGNNVADVKVFNIEGLPLTYKDGILSAYEAPWEKTQWQTKVAGDDVDGVIRGLQTHGRGRLICWAQDGEAHIIDARTGQILQSIARWSGEELEGKKAFEDREWDDSELKLIIEKSIRRVCCVRRLSDDLCLVGRADGSISLWSHASSAAVKTINLVHRPIHDIAVLSDTRFAFWSNADVLFVDLEDEGKWRKLPIPEYMCPDKVIACDGRHLIISAGSFSCVMDITTDEVLWTRDVWSDKPMPVDVIVNSQAEGLAPGIAVMKQENLPEQVAVMQVADADVDTNFVGVRGNQVVCLRKGVLEIFSLS